MFLEILHSSVRKIGSSFSEMHNHANIMSSEGNSYLYEFQRQAYMSWYPSLSKFESRTFHLGQTFNPFLAISRTILFIKETIHPSFISQKTALSIAKVFRNIHFLLHIYQFSQKARCVIFQTNTDVLISQQNIFTQETLRVSFISKKNCKVFLNIHFLPQFH